MHPKTFKSNKFKALFDKLIDFVLSPFALDMEGYTKAYGDLFNKVTDSLFIGARPDETAVPALKEAGITHVVSCLDAYEESRISFLKGDFNHLFLGLHDGIHGDINAVFPQFFKFTSDFERGNPNARLLVHCESGVSRSASLVIAYFMKQEPRPFFDVFKTVKARREQILPNIGFASRLQQLENELVPEDRRRVPSSLALYLHQECNFPAEIDVIESALIQNEYDAVAAIRSVFGGDIPRVIQGVKI